MREGQSWVRNEHIRPCLTRALSRGKRLVVRRNAERKKKVSTASVETQRTGSGVRSELMEASKPTNQMLLLLDGIYDAKRFKASYQTIYRPIKIP